ncbi:MAG TPA: hypothetical protein VLC92_19255 [Rhodocyclaceae bacterium]|nr:hypothetical protein [Rhodocyclaceae bacterium]
MQLADFLSVFLRLWDVPELREAVLSALFRLQQGAEDGNAVLPRNAYGIH